MKKVLKKFFVFALTIIISGSVLVTRTNAAENDLTVGESGKALSVEPMALIYCDKSPNGVHQAYARGIGILYRRNADGSRTLIYNNGCTWQCSYCYHVIITHGEAALGESIGYYATWNPGYQTAAAGTELTASNIWYTSSSRLDGYNFRYN
jgi:hypothetical protein